MKQSTPFFVIARRANGSAWQFILLFFVDCHDFALQNLAMTNRGRFAFGTLIRYFFRFAWFGYFAFAKAQYDESICRHCET